MKTRSFLPASSFALGLLASIAPTVSARASDVQSIEQPLILKLGITAMGIGLIALELRWFLFKQK